MLEEIESTLKNKGISKAFVSKVKKNGLFGTNIIEKKETSGITPYEKIGFFRLVDYNPKLPKHFKGQEVWKEYILDPFEQGSCGSCWAFSITGTYCDRFNIITQRTGDDKIKLSPTTLLVCDKNGKEPIYPFFRHDFDLNKNVANCLGSTLESGWQYVFLNGITTDFCVPYSLTKKPEHSNLSNYGLPLDKTDFLYNLSVVKDSSTIQTCDRLMGEYNDLCVSIHNDNQLPIRQGVPAQFYRSSFYYKLKTGNSLTIKPSDDLTIMNEIFKWGPVSTAFIVYENFYDFEPTTEIYSKPGITKFGGHAVEIVGWGEENGVKFWWVKNSWGKKWGINGYFKFKRGIDLAGIESNVLTGLPDFFAGQIGLIPKTDKNTVDINFYSEDGSIVYTLDNIKSNYFGGSIINQRNKIDYGAFYTQGTITNGGIDPFTGFTRRTMTLYTGHNFSPPENLEQIHKKIGNNTFIAGNIISKLKATKIKDIPLINPQEKNSTQKGDSQVLIICIISIICILFISSIISFIVLRNKRRKHV
jgi:hypothetical protein